MLFKVDFYQLYGQNDKLTKRGRNRAMNVKVNNTLNWMTLLSLAALAMFVFTSNALSALSHLLIFFPGIYFTTQWLKSGVRLSKSSWCLLGFIIVAVIATFFAPDIDVGRKFKLISKLKYFLIPVMAIFAYDSALKNLITKKHIKIMLGMFLVTVSLANISGLIGLFTGFNPLRFKAAADAHRAAGMYGMAMTYGYGIEFVCILLVGVLLYWKRVQAFFELNHKFYLLLTLIATITSIAGLYYSFTRGAMLAFIISTPFLFYQKSKKIFISLIILGAVIITSAIIYVANSKVWGTNRFLIPMSSQTNTIRLSQYHAAWKGFLERPLLGLGYRNFESNSVKIKKRYNLAHQEFGGHTHCNLLEILVDTGIFGFILIFGFHLFWFLEIIGRKDVLGAILVPFWISFIVSGLVQNTIMDSENMFFIMFIYSISQMSPQRGNRHFYDTRRVKPT